MKEEYFTQFNIKEESAKMLNQLQSFTLRHNHFEPDPCKTALLVLDMQDYFLDTGLVSFIPSALAVKDNILQLISHFNKGGLCIIFTRHTNSTANSGLMARWWRNLIAPDSKYSGISAELLDHADKALIIEKNQYDAFHDTGLESILQENQISQVLITGLMTNVCCDTTARSAFVRGYEVYFVIDGTAAHSYDLHISSIRSLSHCCAVPVLTDHIIKILNRGKG